MSAGTRYTWPAALLHALTVPLLLLAVGLGAWMVDLPNGLLRLKAINWHKWAGATVLALALLRVLWRLGHRPPPPPPMPDWQRRVAAATHAGLLVLLLAVPLLGWAYSSAAGFPLVWLGLVPLPDWVPVDRELAQAIKPWHGRVAWALVALVALHVAAALHHQFVLRDGLLRRMAPWRA